MANNENKNLKSTKPVRSSRRLSLPKRTWYDPRTWRVNLPIPPRKPLSSVLTLTENTFRMLRTNWLKFLIITVIYAVSTILLVRSLALGSFSGLDLSSKSMTIWEKVFSVTVQLFNLNQGVNASSATSGIFQIIIFVICSLALIYVFRATLSKQQTSVKMSFYKGMTPLMPYILVLMMMGAHLIPFALGSYLFSLALTVFTGSEYIFAVITLVLFILWSLYLVTHSLFALIIVTLPDTLPLQALRTAKQLVAKRRLLIWRKLLLFSMFVVIATILCIIPFIFWWPSAAPFVFFLLSSVLFTMVQAFIYTLYRELI